MSEYKVEIKQLVDFPRCRIYRQFIQQLIGKIDIRVGSNAGLFHYTVLCYYINFRTSYKRIDGISCTIYPGQWMCRLSELTEWFRLQFQYQALAIGSSVGQLFGAWTALVRLKNTHLRNPLQSGKSHCGARVSVLHLSPSST